MGSLCVLLKDTTPCGAQTQDITIQSPMLYQQLVALHHYQRTIGPENAHLKPDLGVLSHHEMTLTLNTHTPLLTSQVVCICKVSGLRLQ